MGTKPGSSTMHTPTYKLLVCPTLGAPRHSAQRHSA